MPLNNFLSISIADEADAVGIRSADMVFSIIEGPAAGPWNRRSLAHVGIAAQEIRDFELSQNLRVIDFDKYVGHSFWGSNGYFARVDLSGTSESIDDSVRAAIIDTAASFRDMPIAVESLIFKDSGGLYWMGDPDPHGHPLFPQVNHTYSFTCAWFALHCYRVNLPEEIRDILDTKNMPTLSDEEYLALQVFFPVRRIQPQPLKRLFPSYLMAAFESGDLPFDPEDWDDLKDHGRYIPQEMLAK